MSIWVSPRKLRALGILGMNERNIHYIGRFNRRHLFPLVDDKLQTKLLAKKHGIAVPELITTIKSQFEIHQLAERVKEYPGFVIKPAKGSGGKGIVVIADHSEGSYTRSSGKVMSSEDIERHLSNILSGLYSLGGTPDNAIVETLIVAADYFDSFCYEGIPDVRVIVFRGYPVMAMIRLSTADSDGKANLHQGAVGVGLDIATGRAVRAIQYDRPCTHHPDTGFFLQNLQIPDWQNILHTAASCYEMTMLGYLGVDLALDRERGELLLELNARPGLSIQMANGDGLSRRLKLIGKVSGELPVADRVDFSMKHFGVVNSRGAQSISLKVE